VSIEKRVDFTYPSYALDLACSRVDARLKPSWLRADTGCELRARGLTAISSCGLVFEAAS
jgi:hypothetical protein